MERKEITNFKVLSEEPRGYLAKYWIKDGIEKLIKFNNELYPDQDIMEKLSADILKAVSLKCVTVQLGYDSKNKNNCCIIDTFLENEGDITYEVDSNWFIKDTGNPDYDISSAIARIFYNFSSLYNISKRELKDIKDDFLKMILGDCLIGNEDRKLKNVALIFNEKTFQYRLAPSFDNSLAFHCYQLTNSEPVCFIGNQYFNITDVLNYLIKNYYELLEDVIFKIITFTNFDLITLMKKYNNELPYEKIAYIINHIQNVTDILKQKTKVSKEEDIKIDFNK